VKRLRVYIACPLSIGPLDHNIRRANEAMITLMRAGLAPLNPALSCFTGFPPCTEPDLLPRGTTHEDWIDVDLAWAEVSDAVLRLPGESKGADRETAHALQHGIPVFHCIDDLLWHARNLTGRAGSRSADTSASDRNIG
jgi:hypothetical protein